MSQEIAQFLGGVVVAHIFAENRFPQVDNTEKSNGGPHSWDPPFFLDC